MRTTVIALLFTLALLGQGSADLEFKTAAYQADVKGDLKGAIEQYRRIAEKHSRERAIAARATFEMARCYERMGEVEARRLYRQILDRYGDQKDIAQQAQTRLDAIATTSAATEKILARQLPFESVRTDGGWPSPDGKLLYVVDDNYCDGGVVDLTTGKVRWMGWRKDDCSTAVDTLVPSPDGKLLAYRYSTSSKDSEIRICDVDGRNPRTIARSPGRIRGWMGDQKALFLSWTTLQQQGQPAIGSDRVEHWAILDIASGAIREAEFGGQPPRGRPLFLSHDGRWLAYTGGAASAPASAPQNRPAPNSDVYVAPSGGGTPVLAAGGPSNDFPLGWNVDGSVLLISSNRGGSEAIWGIPISEGKPSGEPRLIYPSIPASYYLWGVTRSGTLLVGKDSDQNAALEIEFDGTTGKPKASRRLEFPRDPTYLGDGSRAIYLSLPDRKFVVRDLVTGKERTVSGPCIGSIYGIKGNKALTLCSVPNSGGSLTGGAYHLVDTDTGSSKSLATWTDPMFMLGNPVLSADGSRMYFHVRTATGPRVYRSLGVATLQQRDEWAEPNSLLYGFSPDGKTMAVRRRWSGDDPVLELIQLNAVQNGQLPKPGESRAITGKDPEWSADGKWIFINRTEEGRQRIERIPTGGGPAQTIIEGPDRSIAAFSVHPSGTRVLVYQRTEVKEAWALDNIGKVKF